MFEFSMAQWNIQYEEAIRLMEEYTEYARSIGCTIGEGAMADMIDVPSLHHMELLSKKWKELTESTDG